MLASSPWNPKEEYLNNQGVAFTVIEVKSPNKVLVRFKETKYEKWTRREHIENGCISDKIHLHRTGKINEYSVGSVYSTNSGYLMVTEYVNAKKVEIEFITTGFKKIVSAKQIYTGEVKDPFIPKVQGRGYFGIGPYEPKKQPQFYSVWAGMIRRVYSKSPGYEDASVCKEWLNFQTFAVWMKPRYQEGYQLDKDILVEGNKEYHPDKCMFVSPTVNTFAARIGHRKGSDLPPMIIKNSVNYSITYNRTYLGAKKTLESALRFACGVKLKKLLEIKPLMAEEIYEILKTRIMNIYSGANYVSK